MMYAVDWRRHTIIPKKKGVMEAVLHPSHLALETIHIVLIVLVIGNNSCFYIAL
jgi:hypothetical protein